uniref:Androgen-induced 1 (H. sapiens) n=1 Tax=Astatotilapia calliptera TaxID=8154 RepID=A0A3P8NW72_ASTCA
MALIPSQVLRVAILLSYFSILCHYKALDMPAHQTYGGSWKFLTFIDLVIQAVFFGLCVLIDVSSLLTKGGDSREQERQLRKLIGLRDWMMAVLAFPVGAFVVFTFWSLYLYDRELVYPKLLDNFIPQWLNHGMPQTTGSHHCCLPARGDFPRRPKAGCWSVTANLLGGDGHREAHHCPSLHHHRDADHPPSVSQQVVGSGGGVLLRCGIYPLDMLGAPGDGRVGVPGAGAHRTRSSSRLLQCNDGSNWCLLCPRRNPQQLHLGETTHRKGQR